MQNDEDWDIDYKPKIDWKKYQNACTKDNIIINRYHEWLDILFVRIYILI